MKIHLLFLALFSLSAHAAEKLGEVIMTGPDSAVVHYKDKCSNGAHIVLGDHRKYIDLMMANKDSQLFRLKANLLKQIGDDARGEGVYFGEILPTFHARYGCGESQNSFSFFVVTVTGGNTSLTVSKFLVTFDDDDLSDTRTLKIRSISPVNIRNEE